MTRYATRGPAAVVLGRYRPRGRRSRQEVVFSSDRCFVSDLTVGNPHRLAFIDAMQNWSPFEDVVAAIADAARDQRRVYVERLGDRYRWSLVSNSGYPLLRNVAAYFAVDYTRLYVGFRTVEDELCIVCEDPANFETPDAWTAIDLDPSTDEGELRHAIRSRLG